MKTFSKKEILKKSWIDVKANVWFLASLYLLFVIVISITSDWDIFNTLLSVLGNLIFVLVSIRIINKEKVGYSSLFDGITFNMYLNYLAAYILVGLFVIVSFFLLIFPAFIVGSMLSMTPFILADGKEKNFWKAMKMSKKMTYGYKWKIVGFWFVLIGINILDLLALGVGLLVTLPLSLIAIAYVYKHVSSDSVIEAEVVS